MQIPSWLQVVPEIVSFVVATSLSSLALLPSTKSRHWARWVGVFLLLILSVGACTISLVQKHDADRQAKQDKQDAEKNTKDMQATIDRLAKALEEDVRDKANHPIFLTHAEMLNEPTVGVPLGMQLEWILRLTKDTTFINREGWEIVPIDEDVTALPNPERKKLEEGVWSHMLAEPPLSLTIVFTGSVSGNSLLTTPLTEDQVSRLNSGRALAYFMEEIRDSDTKKVVLSVCRFVDHRNVIEDCDSHNQS